MADGVLDLVGLGFGPAGISLAAVIEDWLEENRCESPWRVRFLEKNDQVVWQGGLLLPNCNIRHHHFRDLATPRNPRSRFTFANYLKENARLFPFCLLSGGVSRIEWADYVAWVAGQLSQYVSYGENAVSVEPYRENGEVSLLAVKTEAAEHLTRNLVLSTGQKPVVPELFQPLLGPRVFHTQEFLTKLRGLDPRENLRFMLIGSGQSAAEAILYLHGMFRESTIRCVQRNSGFKATDEGPFAQMIYLPEETDYFFDLKPEHRAHVTQDVRATNYSVVDMDVCRTLYWTLYEEQIRGAQRIELVRRHKVVGVEKTGDSYRLYLEDVYTGRPHEVESDVLVLCTGFKEEVYPGLLESLRPFIVLDPEGGPLVSRDYRVQTLDGFRPSIFLNGITERTHGLSDSASFSMMALKAEQIFLSSLQPQGAKAPMPIDWTASGYEREALQ